MNPCATHFARQFQKLLSSVFAGLLLLLAFMVPAAAQESPPPTTLMYPQGWTKCADEGNPCWFLGDVRDVAFGANGQYVYLLAVQDSVKCDDDNFWNKDPLKGMKKSCYYSNLKSRLRGAAICAKEGQECRVTGNATIWFGGGGQYFSRQIVAGESQQTTIACHRNTFGDPNQGQGKYCLVTR